MDLLIKGLGRLPGDVRIRAGRVTVPFPVTSTLLVVTTIVLALAACGEAASTLGG
jgi:hypothetical protein